jgi:hypothetical protein
MAISGVSAMSAGGVAWRNRLAYVAVESNLKYK